MSQHSIRRNTVGPSSEWRMLKLIRVVLNNLIALWPSRPAAWANQHSCIIPSCRKQRLTCSAFPAQIAKFVILLAGERNSPGYAEFPVTAMLVHHIGEQSKALTVTKQAMLYCRLVSHQPCGTYMCTCQVEYPAIGNASFLYCAVTHSLQHPMHAG